MDSGEPARVRKRHGRHYTPPALARFLARRLLAHVPQAAETTALRILDPACGDGELLLAIHREAGLLLPGVGVELVGYDLDGAGLGSARARADAAGIAVDWHVGDFLTDSAQLPDASFDAIITNPPYVRTQQLGGPTAQVLSKQFGLHGRIDLTHPFVAIAPRLLRPGGVLGLLCANRFLTTRAGANIRRLLLHELAPVELYDLGDTKLFEAAVLPAVTIATRTGGRDRCRFVSAYQIDSVEPSGEVDLFEALVAERSHLVTYNGRSFAVEIGTLVTGRPVVAAAVGEIGAGTVAQASAKGSGGPAQSTEPVKVSAGALSRAATGDLTIADTRDRAAAAVWRMSRPGLDRWLAQVAAGTWKTFGEVARIRVGIKTTADRVFISDRWAQVRPRLEPALLFDLITHHDVEPWCLSHARGTQVLYPYDTTRPRRTPVDLSEFPGAAAYLRRHAETLAARTYLTDSGREWFEIWVPQRPHLWRVPKLVFPDISERPRFALDRSGAVVNGDCYWISLADLGVDGAAERLAYLLMGVANSTLGLRFYDAVCGNRLYSGRRRWITQYVSRLPLPDPGSMRAGGVVELVRDFVEGERIPDAAALGLLDEWVAAAFGMGVAGSGGGAEIDHR